MNILVAIVSGFASGIFLRTVLVAGWPVAAFAFVLAALAGGAAFLVGRMGYKLAALAFIFVALGIGRAALGEGAPPATFAADLRHRVSYEGVVAADPDLRDTSERIAVRVSKGNEETVVLAVVPRTSDVVVGQRVRVTGTLLPPEPFSGEAGRTFRYDKYLEVDGIRYLLQYGSIRIEGEAPWYSVPAALARVKHWFLDGLSAAMPEPYASLAGGIVIGGKSGLGTELKDAFVKSGLVHIIVLSGYNVMIVAEWMMALLVWLGARRARSAAVGAIALLLFVGIAGFSASAIRATLMALIALYARATGRTYTAGRALLLVAFLILAWNPLYLAFDPGFALSVVATAGLIWLAPIIETFLSGRGALFVQTRSGQTA
ncbi:MAG: ComEC/Rec2 family competence protein, partial [bacterium]|nr:ComEC/Rec2 family competence protein [bacterium]